MLALPPGPTGLLPLATWTHASGNGYVLGMGIGQPCDTLGFPVLLPSPHQSWVVLISIYTNPLKGPVRTGPRTSPGPMRTGPKWSSPQSSLFLRFGGLVLVLVLPKKGSRTGPDWTLKHYARRYCTPYFYGQNAPAQLQSHWQQERH